MKAEKGARQKKPITVVQCKKCPVVFITVGSDKIGVAERSRVKVSKNEDGTDVTGICDNHRNWK